MVDQKVTRQPRQPGSKRSFGRAEGAQRAEDPQENFLGQILGFVRAIGEAVAESINLPGMQPDQFLPRGFVAGEASRYETGIGIQAPFYQIAAAANAGQRINRCLPDCRVAVKSEG